MPPVELLVTLPPPLPNNSTPLDATLGPVVESVNDDVPVNTVVVTDSEPEVLGATTMCAPPDTRLLVPNGPPMTGPPPELSNVELSILIATTADVVITHTPPPNTAAFLDSDDDEIRSEVATTPSIDTAPPHDNGSAVEALLNAAFATDTATEASLNVSAAVSNDGTRDETTAVVVPLTLAVDTALPRNVDSVTDATATLTSATAPPRPTPVLLVKVDPTMVTD